MQGSADYDMLSISFTPPLLAQKPHTSGDPSLAFDLLTHPPPSTIQAEEELTQSIKSLGKILSAGHCTSLYPSCETVEKLIDDKWMNRLHQLDNVHSEV